MTLCGQSFIQCQHDGLGSHRRLSGPELERLKKKIICLFKSHGLSITIQTNLRIVNFLDVTLNLTDETFAPYRKPNSEPLYINVKSNHPPNVIKQLPKSVSKRISLNSHNRKVFEESASEYNRALSESGYSEGVTYQDSIKQIQSVKRTRTRNVIWYNPPYNVTVKTNIGRKFIDLIDKHFSKKNPLSKIFNRNTLKIGYSCTKNMKAVMQSHNNKLINNNINTSNQKQCNCTKNACPLNGTCLAKKCVIYQANIVGPQNEQKKYIGLTEGPFKTRFTGHKQSFTQSSKKTATTLSKYVWENNLQPQPSVTFEILKQTKPYQPGARDCDLCLSEKVAIMNVVNNQMYLNKRNEIKKVCPHKQQHTLKRT